MRRRRYPTLLGRALAAMPQADRRKVEARLRRMTPHQRDELRRKVNAAAVSPELRPCPCGGAASVHVAAMPTEADPGRKLYAVKCAGAHCLFVPQWYGTRADAVRIWNSRAESAAKREG